MMARIVKEPSVRRNEILEVAQRLIETKGYEQMMIQDILDELGLSKGGFYHHFDSKLALLSALIERMQSSMKDDLLALAHDPDIPALGKLAQFFPLLFRWKTTQRGFFLNLLRAWYADDNAVVRQTVQAATLQQLAPPLDEMIQQGIDEGVLTISSADQIGRVILILAQDLSDQLAAWMLSAESQAGDPQQLRHLIAVYTAAIERVLGAPDHSLQIFDLQALNQWTQHSRHIVSEDTSEKEI